MELIQAMKIIEALHLGKSPETEEPLAQGSICLREDVKQALEMALERLAWSVKKKAREQGMPPNQGKPWTPGEDAQLSSEFDQSLPETEISQMHGRTRWAIVKRLEHLGKIPASERTLARAA